MITYINYHILILILDLSYLLPLLYKDHAQLNYLISIKNMINSTTATAQDTDVVSNTSSQSSQVNNIVTDGIGSIGKLIGAKDAGLASVGKKRDSASGSKSGPKDNICRLHRDAQSVFNNINDELPSLHDRAQYLENKLKTAREQYSTVLIPNFKLQEQIYNLENELEKVNALILKIVNRTDEKKYLIQTAPIITKFKKLRDIEHDIMERTSRLEFTNTTLTSQQSLNQLQSADNSDISSVTPKKPMTALEMMKMRKNARKNGSEIPNLPPIVGDVLDMETSTYRMSINISEPKSSIRGNTDDNKVKTNSTTTTNTNTNTNADTASKSNTSKNASGVEEMQEIKTLITRKKKEGISKKRLYDRYMSIINTDYISSDGGSRDNGLADVCNNCHSEIVTNQSTGMLHCTECGKCEKILIDSDKQSHKEPPKEQTNFSYRRINHLNEVLSQIQAKESTNIPDRVYEKFRAELKKRRITNFNNLTNDNGHDILKTIGEADYYEHVPYIISQLNGRAPPTISPEVEEIIRSLFMHTQHPFSKHCPEERNNFVTYNFTLYKLFQLLELDELLPNLKASLKDRTKQYYQDRLWKKICAELRWQYIPTE